MRYGRGAYIYQSMRRTRGSGTIREDLEFHRTLVSRVRRRLRDTPGILIQTKVIAALALWQAANAGGFASEAVSHRLRRRATG